MAANEAPCLTRSRKKRRKKMRVRKSAQLSQQAIRLHYDLPQNWVPARTFGDTGSAGERSRWDQQEPFSLFSFARSIDARHVPQALTGLGLSIIWGVPDGKRLTYECVPEETKIKGLSAILYISFLYRLEGPSRVRPAVPFFVCFFVILGAREEVWKEETPAETACLNHRGLL